jgi:hypothetical protein
MNAERTRMSRTRQMAQAAAIRLPRVMAGLVPAIHAAPLQTTVDVGDCGSAGMPGTGPGMTRGGCGRADNASGFAQPDSRGTRLPAMTIVSFTAKL